MNKTSTGYISNNNAFWNTIKQLDNSSLKNIQIDFNNYGGAAGINEKPVLDSIDFNSMSSVFTKAVLESIEIDGYSNFEGTVRNLDFIQYFKNLRRLKIDKLKVSVIPNLSELNQLDTIIITNSNMVNIDKLASLSSLKNIDFTNNQIASLVGLVGLNLNSLILKDNTIKNTVLTSNGEIDNVDILNNLKNDTLIQNIDIRNNKFTDLSRLDWIINK